MAPALDEYIERVEIPDDGQEGSGAWLVCTVCERSWRPQSQEEHADGCLVSQARALQAENERLREYLRLDHSGLAASLVSIQRELDGWSWLADEEDWGGYEYDEHTTSTLRREAACLLSRVGALAREGCLRSGTLVTYAVGSKTTAPPVALTSSEIEHLLWAWAEHMGLRRERTDPEWACEHARVLDEFHRRHGSHMRTMEWLPHALATLIALDVRRRGAADVWQAIAWLRSPTAARAIRGLGRGESRESFLLEVLAQALSTAYAEQMCLPTAS